MVAVAPTVTTTDDASRMIKGMIQVSSIQIQPCYTSYTHYALGLLHCHFMTFHLSSGKSLRSLQECLPDSTRACLYAKRTSQRNSEKLCVGSFCACQPALASIGAASSWPLDYHLQCAMIHLSCSSKQQRTSGAFCGNHVDFDLLENIRKQCIIVSPCDEGSSLQASNGCPSRVFFFFFPPLFWLWATLQPMKLQNTGLDGKRRVPYGCFYWGKQNKCLPATLWNVVVAVFSPAVAAWVWWPHANMGHGYIHRS